MSDWLKRKDLCSRCFSGIDDDHDGNCPTCASINDDKALWMKKTRLKMEINWEDMDTLAVISSIMQ